LRSTRDGWSHSWPHKKRLPKERILDAEASDIPWHGEQEFSPFHGDYAPYGNLPLDIYCGKALLACALRNSRIDGAPHAAALIKLLVKRLGKPGPECESSFGAIQASVVSA
jgi:hypothetical protein